MSWVIDCLICLIDYVIPELKRSAWCKIIVITIRKSHTFFKCLLSSVIMNSQILAKSHPLI